MIRNQELIKRVETYGFTLVRSKRHLVFAHPSGATLVTAQSPSDHRHFRNIERDIKRVLKAHGID